MASEIWNRSDAPERYEDFAVQPGEASRLPDGARLFESRSQAERCASAMDAADAATPGAERWAYDVFQVRLGRWNVWYLVGATLRHA